MSHNHKIDRLRSGIAAVAPADWGLRLFCAWCVTALVIALRVSAPVTKLEAYHAFGILPAAIIFVSVFFLLSVVCDFSKYKKAAVYCLPAAFAAYSLVLVYRTRAPWFVLSLSAVWALLLFCYGSKGWLRFPPLPDRSPKLLTAGFIALFFLVVGAMGVLNYRTFLAPNFDFGIFCQMFYNMKTRFLPLTTCEREYLLSHFAVHFSPLLYALLPAYFLFPFPETLQLAQAAILASAAVPAFLLAKRLRLSNRIALAFAALTLLHPAVGGGTYYDFHENCFLLPLLLWTFLFFEKENCAFCALFAGLTLLTKEDAAVYIVFFAFYAFCGRKKYRFGLCLGLAAAAYFAFAYWYLSVRGLGVMTGRYDNFIVDDGGLAQAVVNVLQSPAYVFTQLFVDDEGPSAEKVLFALQLFAPLCFLPFCCKQISRLTLLFPALLLNFMTLYQYQFRIGFQYAFGSVAFLLYLSLLNVGDLSADTVRKTLCAALAVSFLCFFSTSFCQAADALKDYRENQAQYALMRETLRGIPADAAVAASTFLCPHLSSREVLYEDEYHEPLIGEPIDYVIIDQRYDHEEEIGKFAAVGFTETRRVEYQGEELLLIMEKEDMR